MDNRKIDELVAIHVMEWDEEGISAELYIGWSPSKYIEHAWEVVEKMREWDVFEFRMTWHGSKGNNGFTFRIWETEMPHVDMEEFTSDTAPLAICLAALKAKGVDIETL